MNSEEGVQESSGQGFKGPRYRFPGKTFWRLTCGIGQTESCPVRMLNVSCVHNLSNEKLRKQKFEICNTTQYLKVLLNGE